MNFFLLFFFNDSPTTEIYTLSLHDALPIFLHRKNRNPRQRQNEGPRDPPRTVRLARRSFRQDRKSTRLNSSHLVISYAVFCLKKKKNDHNVPKKSNIVERTIRKELT